MGTWTQTSYPSRWNIGSAVTVTCTITSPAGPPLEPASPWPRSAKFWSSSIPAGIHLQRLARGGLAGAVAGLAGVPDKLAPPAAVAAGLLALHYAKGGALLCYNITTATAVRAGFGAGTLSRTGAAAVGAVSWRVMVMFFLSSRGRLLKGQDHAHWISWPLRGALAVPGGKNRRQSR